MTYPQCKVKSSGRSKKSHHHFSILANSDVSKKIFAFPEKNNIPFYHVSASNGTNVVTVS
jgi:hypothetical protein